MQFKSLFPLLLIMTPVSSLTEVEEDVVSQLRSIGVPTSPFSFSRFRCRRKVKDCRNVVGDSLPFEEWYSQLDQLQGDTMSLRETIEQSESVDYSQAITDMRNSNVKAGDVRRLISRLQAIPDAIARDGLLKTVASMLDIQDDANRLMRNSGADRHLLRRRLDDTNPALTIWLFLASLPFRAIYALFLVNPVLTTLFSPLLALGIIGYFLMYGTVFVIFYTFALFGAFGGGGRIAFRVLYSEDCMEEYLQCDHERSLSTSIPAMIEAAKAIESNP